MAQRKRVHAEHLLQRNRNNKYFLIDSSSLEAYNFKTSHFCCRTTWFQKRLYQFLPEIRCDLLVQPSTGIVIRIVKPDLPDTSKIFLADLATIRCAVTLRLWLWWKQSLYFHIYTIIMQQSGDTYLLVWHWSAEISLANKWRSETPLFTFIYIYIHIYTYVYLFIYMQSIYISRCKVMRISRKAHMFEEKNRRFAKSANVSTFHSSLLPSQRLHRTILTERSGDAITVYLPRNDLLFHSITSDINNRAHETLVLGNSWLLISFNLSLYTFRYRSVGRCIMAVLVQFED